MKPLLRTITTCPDCHFRLEDEERDGKEVKVCYSEACRLMHGESGQVFECYECGSVGE